MTLLKRRVAAVSAPLLLALSLTACGGGASDAPDDASTDDFCKIYTDSFDALSTDDKGEAVDAAHKLADKLADTGTPGDLSDEERNGFEKFVEFLGDVSTGDIDDLEGQDTSDVFGDDTADVEAFLTYVGTKCVPDIPTDIPTDIPS